MTLTQFLLARIAEDEAEIGPHYIDRDEGAGPNGIGWAEVDAISEVLMASQHRMLRECEAKRELVDDLIVLDADYKVTHSEATENRRFQALVAVSRAAAVYSDHPDYQPEWRP